MHYRRIYENHYGPIPTEPDGRTYDIHHIDSNRKNNVPSNLIALTVQQHYDLHWSQGDLGACYYIALRMDKTPEELSLLGKLIGERWKYITHHAKGTKWFNNGTKQGMFKDCPEGWVPGRLNFNNKGSKIGAAKQKNKRWYNNGTEEGMYLIPPDGWTLGRILKHGKKGRSNIKWSEATKKGWETRRAKLRISQPLPQEL